MRNAIYIELRIKYFIFNSLEKIASKISDTSIVRNKIFEGK